MIRWDDKWTMPDIQHNRCFSLVLFRIHPCTVILSHLQMNCSWHKIYNHLNGGDESIIIFVRNCLYKGNTRLPKSFHGGDVWCLVCLSSSCIWFRNKRQYTRVERLEIASVYQLHYSDVIMGTIASQITSLTIVYSAVYLDAGQRKYQSSASLAFVRRIHRRPVNCPHKWPVTRKMFPFDGVIM